MSGGPSSRRRSPTLRWFLPNPISRSLGEIPSSSRISRFATASMVRLNREWQRTHDFLLSITGQSQLLESKPGLNASIKLRLPYIEPLNLLQIELLKRRRARRSRPADH